MFEELKKKALKNSLVFSIILMIIGVVMVGLMATNMYHIVFGYADFEQLEPDEIKNQLVEFDMTTNFGCYLEEYEYNKNTYRSTTTALYYIVWTGDEYAEDYRYMSVKVPASYEWSMEEIADNTYNDLLSDPVTLRGKIKKLDDEEYGYFVEFFEESGWTEEEIESGTLPYYIDCYEKGATADGGYILIFAAGLIFLAWGIIRVVKACTNGYVKKLRKDIADAGYTESMIEGDYRNAVTINEKTIIKIGRLMTYFMSGSDVRALPNNKMVWAYMNTVTHRTNGVKTGTTYNVAIELENRNFTISVDNEEMALNMLKKFDEMFPWVVVGYSDELKTLFRKNRAEFLALRYNTCEHVAVEPGFERENFE